jgi:hypothetical protein
MRAAATLPIPLALAACAAPVAPPPAAIAPVADEARAERLLLSPLELPAPAVPPAPWRTAPVAVPREPWSEPAKPLFTGVGAALVSTGAGVFAIHRAHGVVGPLRPPASAWLGLDGQDRVYAAAPGGELFRAPDVLAAADGGFARVGAVPGAVAWDASTTWVAAATPSQAWLSADGGVTFRALGPEPGAVVSRVFVRGDGVVVAQGSAGGADATWTGRAGRRLRRSTHVGELQRVGGWIVSATCPVVLSSDGARWTELPRWPDDYPTLPIHSGWLETFVPRARLVAFTREFPGSLVDPAPPPPGSPPNPLGCHRGMPPRVRMGVTQAEMRCGGATYVSGTLDSTPPSRAELALFGDAACARADEDPNGLQENGCGADAPLTRPPRVAILDRGEGTMRASAPPPGCRPERLVSAGGVGVLLCATSSGAAVYIADGSGAWQAEGTLPFRASEGTALSAAPDGTLLLRVAWEGATARRAFVRSPRALGDRSAWRSVDLGDAFELRVDVGGAVVVFETASRAPLPGWLTVARDAPGEPRRPLSGRIPVEGTLEDGAIEGRRVFFWLSSFPASHWCVPRPAPDHEGLARYVLSRGGNLVPAP